MFTGFLRYFLAWIMLTYVAIKIIPAQFPFLMANMDSTFIELAQMRVTWTFFGYSKGYQMLVSWAEAIHSLLLLFRRTWLLGALLRVPVLVQVLAVSLFVDVCVKLNTSIYQGIAVFLLLSESDRLWTFFIAGKSVPPKENLRFFQNHIASHIAGIANGLLVAGILGYIAYQG